MKSTFASLAVFIAADSQVVSVLWTRASPSPIGTLVP